MLGKNFFQSFLVAFGFLISISRWSAAMEEPKSESSFHYFTTDEGTLGQLHDHCYTHHEIEILENYVAKLSEPRSLEKDEVIAKYLAKQIKKAHHQSILEALADSCFFIPSSSLPEDDNLERIIVHGLYGKKFFIFGRNRTFKVLKDRLLWVDNDNKPTPSCPSVFKSIWEKALSNAVYF